MRWFTDDWVGTEDHDIGRIHARISFSERFGDYAWRVHLILEGGGTSQIIGRADDVALAKRKASRATRRILKNPNKYLEKA